MKSEEQYCSEKKLGTLFVGLSLPYWEKLCSIDCGLGPSSRPRDRQFFLIRPRSANHIDLILVDEKYSNL